MAELVKHFRDSYWPGGILAEPLVERSLDVKSRMRMVTKAKMIGGIPDELKRFLGMEVVREGVTRVFDMFQHINLNKRLLYVISEAFLETIFPDNKFKEIFLKCHTKRNWYIYIYKKKKKKKIMQTYFWDLRPSSLRFLIII